MPSSHRAQARATAKVEKYQRRYGEIIDAVAAVFAEKGYHGASTKDIADRLGIRQGSLYYYFASKESALEEVCQIGVEGFV
jgi:TetR/AcrR family transcriptional regulator, cholesterol catabolism regulator